MLQDILTKQKRFFDPAVHTELRGQLNRQRRVILLSGNVVANSRSDVSGVSARVWRGGTCGFSSMAEYSEEAARKVLQAAGENAAFMDAHVPAGKKPLPALKYSRRALGWDIRDPAQKEYIEAAKALDAYVAEHCPKLLSRRVVAMEDSMEKLLATSDGMDAHVIAPRSYCYVILTAATDEGAPVEILRSFGGEGTFDKNFADPSAYFGGIDELYEQLMQKREGVYADAGLKTVILGAS